MASFIEELFNKNKEQLDLVRSELKNKDGQVSSFSYALVESTLAEAQAFLPVKQQIRFITNARKSGETAGNGTGLPSFYDPSSGNWLDFSGSVITV